VKLGGFGIFSGPDHSTKDGQKGAFLGALSMSRDTMVDLLALLGLYAPALDFQLVYAMDNGVSSAADFPQNAKLLQLQSLDIRFPRSVP
jgi:hypothetical protein